MNYCNYYFSPELVYESICRQWYAWSSNAGNSKWVIGMSGGKDSLVSARLAADTFGKENVYGVMMPNGNQKDQEDAKLAIESIGINDFEVNIGKAYEELIDGIAYCGMVETITADTRINLAPRIRMSVLFGIAQSIGGMVVNTDNLSERICGYSTLGGDDMGSYAPIQDLTVTEVLALGDWLKLPAILVHKKPGDGLQDVGDEDRLCLKYADLDVLIRNNKGKKELIETATKWYLKNRFKADMIRLNGPVFGFPNSFNDLSFCEI